MEQTVGPEAISSSEISWYVLRGEDRYGPVPNGDVLAAYRAGEFLAGDLVWREGFEEWKPAEEALAEFVAASEATAPDVEPATGPATGLATGTTDVAEAVDAIADTSEPRPDAPTDEPGAAHAASLHEVAAADDGPAADADATTTAAQDLAGLQDKTAAAVAAAVELIAREVSEGAAAIAAPVADVAAEAIAGAASAVETMAAPASPAAEGAAASLSGVQSFASLTAPPTLPPLKPASAAAEPLWPMPVADFLKGPYLQRADVVLTRKNKDLKSWLIRFATKGSFSHAALVFLVPHLEKGFDNAFVIESASGGVDLTNFADYVNDRRSVIGIKRLDVPWFTDEVQCAVRGRMLNSIKSTYDYATILRLARELLADIAFGIKSRVMGPSKAIRSSYEKEIQPPNKFICSGLVQLGFVHTLLDMAAEKRLPPEFLSDIVFRDDLRAFLPEDWNEFSAEEQHEVMWEFATGFADLLEAATPEDLASSPQLKWVYVIRRGMVFPATSEEHVRELLTWKPQQRRER